MQYGQIIGRAAQLTWRNKVLWVLGIAIALFGGMYGGHAGTGVRYSFGSGDVQRWAQQVSWGGTGVVSGLLAVMGLVTILALVWALVGILVRYTSLGALISMTAEIEAGNKPTLGDGLQRGWGRFLRLWAISLLIGLVGALVGLLLVLLWIALGAVIALPALALFRSGGGWVIALGVAWSVFLGVAWLGVGVIVAFVVSGALAVAQEYAHRVCVLEEEGNVLHAIGAGVTLLRARLKESAAMWLLQAAIQLGLAILFLPIGLLLAGGAVILIAAVASGRSALPAFSLGAPLALLGGLVMLLVNGVYTVFYSAVWTLFYQELRAQPEA